MRDHSDRFTALMDRRPIKCARCAHARWQPSSPELRAAAFKGVPSRDEMLAKRETLELVRAYYGISDREVRDKIRKLVQAAAKLG